MRGNNFTAVEFFAKIAPHGCGAKCRPCGIMAQTPQAIWQVLVKSGGMPHAVIKTAQAKLTLLQLHAELGGKILDNETEADRLRQAMEHVEAVIKILDPAHNLRTIAVRRRKPNAWFKRGTIWRAVLDAMRCANAPVTVSEIAQAMLADKRIKDAPRSAVENLEGSIRAALKYRDGRAVAEVGSMPVRWALKTGLERPSKTATFRGIG